MLSSTSSVLAVLVAVLTTACGVRVLPPRMAPSRVMPNVAIPQGAPPAQHGRVVLDVQDGKADVTAVADRPVAGQPWGHVPVTGRLCTTPCVAELPYGRYRLYLSTVIDGETRGDSDELVVDRERLVYRRALGQSRPADYNQALPLTMITLGLLAVSFTPAVIAVEDPGAQTGLVAAGVVGTAVLVGGIVWLTQYRAVEQSGSTTVWSP